MPAPSSIPSPPNQPNQPLATFNSVKEQLKSRTKRWESEAVLCNNKNEYLSKKLEYLQDVVDIQQRALDTLHIDAEKSSVLRQSIQLSQLEISSLLSVVNLDDARPSRQGVALDAAPPQPSSFQVRRPMTNDIYDNWNSPSPNNTYTPNTSSDRFQNRLGSLVPSEHIPLEIPNGYLDQNGRRNNNTFSTQSKPTPGDDYYGTAFERVGSLGWSPVRSNASPLRPSISPTYPRISNTPHPQGNPIPIHRRWPTPNSRNSAGWDNTPSSPSINMRKPMLTSSEDTFSDSSGQELSQALSISYRNGVAVDLEGLQDEIDALKYSNQPIPSSKVGEMLQKVLEVVQASNDDKKELERKLSKYKQRTKQLERHIIQQTYNDDHKGILNREPARPAYTISPSVNSRPSYTSLNNRRSPNSRESLGRASPRVSHRSPARRTAL